MIGITPRDSKTGRADYTKSTARSVGGDRLSSLPEYTTFSKTPKTPGTATEVDTSGADGLKQIIERYQLENSPEEVQKREKAIRDEVSALREARIDLIDRLYSPKIAREQKLGEERLAQQRSLNLRAGLGGSDFGAANKDEVKQNTNKVIDSIEDEKALEVDRIFGEFDKMAADRVKADQDARRTQAEDAIKMSEKIVSMAEDKIKTLGASGVNLAKLKSDEPDLYDSIRRATGKTDLEIDSMLNNSLPESMKVKYETEKIMLENGNAGLLKYGIDPMTGKVTKQQYDLGIKYETLNGVETKEVDGVLYKVDPRTGNLTALTSRRQRAGEDDSFKFDNSDKAKLLGANFTEGDVANIEDDISANGIDSVLAGITNPDQKKALMTVMGKSEKFLDRNYLMKTYGLKDERGFGGLTGGGKKKLDELESYVAMKRATGKDDSEILDELLKDK